MKKTTFFVCIFDISRCVFTQISSGRAHWMQNLIPHPTSTHTAYFWRTSLPYIFSGISCFWGSKVRKKICSVATHWTRNQIPHPTSSPTQNLNKNIRRYVENKNTKVVFFILPPKLITIILNIILLLSLGGPF